MKPQLFRQLTLSVMAASSLLSLSACWWDDDDGATTKPQIAAVGTIDGVAVASSNSAPVANAKVSAGGITAQTDAQGRFTLKAVPAAAAVVVRVQADKYLDGLATVALADGQTAQASTRLISASAATNIDPNTTVTVKAPSNVNAQVVLAAGSIENPATKQAAAGPVSVKVTPIDPALDPQTMPGNYTTSKNERIESFGAINVSLSDASGAPLNLKAGSKATIRIPVASRASTPPASIPLFYFNEQSGLWVQEGSAALVSTASGRYYEGSVTHFSTWNGDRVQDSVRVNGCIKDAKGAVLSRLMTVDSMGLDYSGVSSVLVTIADGKFSIPIKKGGRASLTGLSWLDLYRTNTVVVAASQTDVTLPECLVLNETPVAPSIVTQPDDVTGLVGDSLYLGVTVSGTGPVQYQWFRNGSPIAGATYSGFGIPSASLADNGAVYSVKVTTPAGTVTSANATLTVKEPVLAAPQISRQPADQTAVVNEKATFSVTSTGYPAPTYQWQRNGVNIPDATSPSYTTPALSLADSGSNFSVIIRNSQGSVTSTAAQLSVTAAADVDKVKLMRLVFSSLQFFDAGLAPTRLLDSKGSGTFFNPATFCTAGSVVSATLNGEAVIAGQVPPLKGTIAATFDNCTTRPNTKQIYSGSSEVKFDADQYPKPNRASWIMTLNQMRLHYGKGTSTETDYTGNGAGTFEFSQTRTGADTVQSFTRTPSPGSTLRNELNGLTATFNSGSLSANATLGKQTTDTYNKLNFTVAGVTYVADGFYKLDFSNPSAPSGSGEVLVTTAGGTRIGRIYIDFQKGGPVIETDGVVSPLK